MRATTREACRSIAMAAAAMVSAPWPCPVGADALPASAILLRQVDAAIGSAACTRDAHCRSIGIGEMACGGPQAYRAWSTVTTDAHALEALVARHRELRMREIRKGDEQSICIVITDPGAFCLIPPSGNRGRCQLRPDTVPPGSSTIR